MNPAATPPTRVQTIAITSMVFFFMYRSIMPTANAPTMAISEGNPSMFLSMSESMPAGAYAAPMADIAGVENDLAY